MRRGASAGARARATCPPEPLTVVESGSTPQPPADPRTRRAPNGAAHILAFNSCNCATRRFTSSCASIFLPLSPSALSLAFSSRISLPTAVTCAATSPLGAAAAAGAGAALGAALALALASSFFASAFGSAFFSFRSGGLKAASTACGFATWEHIFTDPMTHENWGMAQQPSNQAQTLGKGFLKAGSNTREKPSRSAQTSVMSARVTKSPMRNFVVFSCASSSVSAFLTSACASFVAAGASSIRPMTGYTHVINGTSSSWVQNSSQVSIWHSSSKLRPYSEVSARHRAM
mmetsp:Transcript_97779/g.272052  ORF Transcript_97779/g.272052 Transcript_97779/m.272052 type:complete len:289 (-) Transcript_97779:156-1022(-)